MPPAGGSFSPSPSLQGESGEEVENVAVEASHSRVNDLSRKLAAKPLGLCRGPPGREGAPPFERFRFGGRGETNAAGALHVPEQKRQRLGSIYGAVVSPFRPPALVARRLLVAALDPPVRETHFIAGCK